jgi:hypothetical protein
VKTIVALLTILVSVLVVVFFPELSALEWRLWRRLGAKAKWLLGR